MSDRSDPAASAAAGDPLPTLDARQLAELRALSPAGDEWLLSELIGPFLRGCRQAFEDLQVAHRRMEPLQIERLAHNLKGACGTIGVRALADIARGLVEAARAGRLQAVPALLDRFAAEHARVVVALRREFPALPET